MPAFQTDKNSNMEKSFHHCKILFEEDEICRINKENELEFGVVLKKNQNESYEVDWKSKKIAFMEKNYKPSESHPPVLINRRHSEGRKVVHRDGRIGTIVDTKILTWLSLPNSRQILKDVPSDDLTTLSLFTGELIEFNGWVGKVSSVDWLVTIVYSDGMHCNIQMTQTHRSNTSFGYEVYSKSSPPCVDQIVHPTAKEYSTAEWLGTSMFDSKEQLNQAHLGKNATVVGSQIHKVFVKWLHKLKRKDNEKVKMPRILESKSQIEGIKQFDFRYKEWLKTHSICEYKLKEQDELIEENKFVDLFIKDIDSDEVLEGGPTKKSKVDTKPPGAGNIVLAEVLRLRHCYNVRWDPQTEDIGPIPLELTLGTALAPWVGTPLTSYGFDIRTPFRREYVMSKLSFPLIEEDLRSTFGVTQNRHDRDELVELIWYRVKEQGHIERLGPSVSTLYELLPHRRFSGLKPGAVVTHAGGKKELLTVGMVIRINEIGLVEVYCGNDEAKRLFAPNELVTVEFPEDAPTVIDKNTTFSGDLDAENLDFAQALANDMEEILENKSPDIKVKFAHANARDSFSVLIVGPKDTPYEDGIFIFDVRLPRQYPNVPPVIHFRSIPQGRAFLSHHLTLTGDVLLPILNNWPGTDKEKWKREYSLLDFLIILREGIFVREPYLSHASLKFDKSKNRLAAEDHNVLATMTQMNDSIVITVTDLLLSQHQFPPLLWKTEIAEHVLTVFPRIKNKLKSWVESPIGVFGDLDDFPKYHLFPISYGFSHALTRRMGLLDDVIKSEEDDSE